MTDEKNAAELLQGYPAAVQKNQEHVASPHGSFQEKSGDHFEPACRGSMFDAMIASGIGCPKGGVIADGNLHRFNPNGRHDASGWYVSYGDYAAFGDWASGIKETWCARKSELTDFERRKLYEEIEVERKKREAEGRARHEAIAARISAACKDHPDATDAPYLTRKCVQAFNIKCDVAKPDVLILPMRDVEGRLWNYQAIYPDGTKRLQKGARKKGCFLLIGATDLSKVAFSYVVEGYATGASVHMASGKPVIVAFDAGNLDPVVAAVRSHFSSMVLVIAGDDDRWKPEVGNTGRATAEAVAQKYGCRAVFPVFKVDDTAPTDFNDLHVLEGLGAVLEVLEGSERTMQSFQETPQVSTETLSDAVTRLAALPPLDYEQVREAEAKRFGVRVSVLDGEVMAVRGTGGDKNIMIFPPVRPWPEPVNGAALLHEIEQTVHRFIVCEPETARAAALWIAFSWSVEFVDVAPLVVITAPEKRCGKSQLLNLIARLAKRPLVASNISPAAIYRVIEAHCPTLLIDEADSFFKDNEELRGVINSGHTRQSAYVWRIEGDKLEPKQFSTWGAKAISGIGSLSETIMDRAVVLELRRKLPHESVGRLRHAEEGLFERLASMLARWSTDHGPAIKRARPSLPDALNDRAQDNWEPLLAIADCAGGDWPQLAREAALKLSGKEQDTVSLSAELLADIQEVFESKRVDRIGSHDLLAALMEDDQKPWATYNRGKPMNPRQLAKRLGEYGIKSSNVRIGLEVRKKFRLDDFKDVFARYLTPSLAPSPKAATTLQIGDMPCITRSSPVADNPPRSGCEIPCATPNILEENTCSGVADNNTLPWIEEVV
ncbi:MAG: DUF3631 domain-containing protein [Alphaproteobacteria bacterium]|nr:DUF3631 domain-containing protein [Alphaproteobacteria bacterium]